MTEDVNNGIQAEQGLPPRDESGNGQPEGTPEQSSHDPKIRSDSGKLVGSGERSEVVNGDIQDEAESYDPRQAVTGSSHTIALHHEGPLPEPSQLAAYARAGADFPERIVRMTEKQIEARTDSINRLSKADAFATYAGMFMVTGMALLGLAGAFVGGVLMDKPGAFALAALPVLNYLPKLIDSIKGRGSDE